MQWKLITDKKKKETKTVDDIINILLENRGLKTDKEKNDFFNPIDPEKITLKQFGIDPKEINKTVKRILAAVKDNEKIVIYGDYDTDGICATAILWEEIYSLTKNVIPHIPNRFTEGYGLNPESIKRLKKDIPQLKLIITVDNGIVASDAVVAANKLGVDVIITDHHQKGKTIPKAFSIIHSTEIGGAGVAWILSREISKNIASKNKSVAGGLELAAVGTIADQIPLLGVNRSLVKYGLIELNNTKRPGLQELFREAALEKDGGRFNIGTYEVGFVIAPRLNAMGRLEHALDSLRILCTNNRQKAKTLAQLLGKTNLRRQRIVEEVVAHAKELAVSRQWKGVIVLSHSSYHEGVIGLAAAKLVEEFWRPAIVISQGKKTSKASARSISGFNIIENIRKLESLIVGGGGHPMAAGFSIETLKITEFTKSLEEISSPLLTSEILERKLKVDCELEFDQIGNELLKKIENFEPTGLGNSTPTFVIKSVGVSDARGVGNEGKHLKLKLQSGDMVIDGIAFGLGKKLPLLKSGKKIDVVFTLVKNIWNGNESLQLKIKDLKVEVSKFKV